MKRFPPSWRRLAAGLLTFGLVAAHAAPPGAWRVDPQATQIHWEAMHFGTSTSRGRFEQFEVQLGFDPQSRQGELAVTVNTASVTTGLAPFDQVLRGSFMLDAARHPQAWYIARQFEFDGDRLVAVRGELTLRGTSRGLTLRALRFGCSSADAVGPVCGGDFEGELRRSDFGINYALPFGADRVRLFVSVQARRP